MHQTKKGQQWYFGMKAHIGVDVESGLVHTVTTTPANVGDVTEVSKLLHGKEKTRLRRRWLSRGAEARPQARPHVAYRRQARQCQGNARG